MLSARSAPRRFRLASAFLLGLPLAVPRAGLAAQGASPDCAAPLARIVSLQGTVEVHAASGGPWTPVTRLDTPICEGDVLHVGSRSRAALVAIPENLIRLDQNSTMALRRHGDSTEVEMLVDERVPRGNWAALAVPSTVSRGFRAPTG